MLFYSYSKPIFVSEMLITIFCVTVIKLNIFKMISEKFRPVPPPLGRVFTTAEPKEDDLWIA